MASKTWAGVLWHRPKKGLCPKHDCPVGVFTGLCFDCHREQLAAAAAGSSEWEIPEWHWSRKKAKAA